MFALVGLDTVDANMDDPSTTLDPSDADFVLEIHTSGQQEKGHADFYPIGQGA